MNWWPAVDVEKYGYQVISLMKEWGYANHF